MMALMLKSVSSSRKILLCLASLFLLAIVGRLLFRFTHSYLNYAFAFSTLTIPWLALKPFLRLQKWDRRWWGSLLLYPIMFMTLLIALNLACGLESRHHRIQDVAVIERDGFRVRLISDCGRDPAPCSLDLRQERLIAPGLLLVRTLDSIDGAVSGEISNVGPDTVRVRTTELDHRPSPESRGHVDRVYQVKRFVYF
jgi:hypothetical protein